MMLRNYLKIALRSLWKHKTNTAINLLGLTVAFTICLLLVLSVYYEFSFNRFHYKAGDLYRTYFRSQPAGGTEYQPTMPEPLLNELKAQFPVIQYGTRLNRHGCEFEYNGKHFFKLINYADTDFFLMFSLPLRHGHASEVLSDPNNIVLTREMAEAIYGNEDPVGKPIRVKAGSTWQQLTVSGVTESIPENSSLKFDGITRFENQEGYALIKGLWGSTNHDVIIRLKPGASAAGLEKAMQGFINKQYAPSIRDLKRDGATLTDNGQYLELLLQPFVNVHTDTFMRAVGDSVSRSYLYILLAVAVFVMLIACINFINLSVGRSFTRTREVGLRKTLGALPRQVAAQFWGEAALTCGFALLISVPLFYFLLPHYNKIFGSTLQTDILQQPGVIVVMVVAFLAVTLMAGGYPAWIMTRLNANSILKGTHKLKTSGGLRNGLIIGQFAIAIALIGCTLVAWNQLRYLRSLPLGYNSAQVISIPVGHEVNGKVALELLRQKLAQEPAVESVSGVSNNLGVGIDGGSYTWIAGFDYRNKAITMNWLNVSHDFVKTLDLQLLAGRDFSQALASDSGGIVINEEMKRSMGVADPIGELLVFDTTESPLKVIGVVKNFNFQSLHQPVAPMGFVMYRRMPVNYLMVKVRPDNLAVMMNKLSAAWSDISPREEFKGSFLDENINRQYNRESRFTTIFVYAAVVAIILSCLGLFALAVLAIMQRTREIGIRKALGASAGSIVQLVTRDFIRLILISMLLGIPAAYYFMNAWLNGFAFSVEIRWWWLLAAGLLALVVAMFTIGYQSLRAAFSNPVKALKTE